MRAKLRAYGLPCNAAEHSARGDGPGVRHADAWHELDRVERGLREGHRILRSWGGERGGRAVAARLVVALERPGQRVAVHTFARELLHQLGDRARHRELGAALQRRVDEVDGRQESVAEPFFAELLPDVAVQDGPA